jgi:hypothetical protein
MKHINEVIKSNGPATKMQDDKNYCTVTALAATFGMSYDKAYSFASLEWSRKKGRGVATITMLGSFPQAVGKDYAKKVLSQEVERVKAEHDYKQPDGSIKTRDMNLSTFTKKYPRGKYYILVKGHALAIINGEIVDHTDKPKRRIRYAWKVS